MQTRGPALRALEELVDLGVGQLDSRCAEQDLGLTSAQRELVGADLEQRPAGAELGDRQPWEYAPRKCDH